MRWSMNTRLYRYHEYCWDKEQLPMGNLLKMYFSCPDLLFVDDRLIELKHNGFPSAILANTKKNEKIGSDWMCSQVDDKKKKALGVWCEHGELNEFQLTKWN